MLLGTAAIHFVILSPNIGLSLCVKAPLGTLLLALLLESKMLPPPDWWSSLPRLKYNIKSN